MTKNQNTDANSASASVSPQKKQEAQQAQSRDHSMDQRDRAEERDPRTEVPRRSPDTTRDPAPDNPDDAAQQVVDNRVAEEERKPAKDQAKDDEHKPGPHYGGLPNNAG